MRVPYKPVYFQKSYKKFNYIIVHDYTCQFSKFDKARVDSKKITVNDIRSYNWLFNDEFDLPFHFVCKKFSDDFETILSRPLSYYCEYSDIPSQYLNSVHIAIAGKFDFITPEARAYQQMGYRSIASIMRWFAIPVSNILMHWEVSKEKDLHCPGLSFDKDKLLSLIKPLILVKR